MAIGDHHLGDGRPQEDRNYTHHKYGPQELLAGFLSESCWRTLEGLGKTMLVCLAHMWAMKNYYSEEFIYLSGI
jgi:hypothetical protein